MFSWAKLHKIPIEAQLLIQTKAAFDYWERSVWVRRINFLMNQWAILSGTNQVCVVSPFIYNPRFSDLKSDHSSSDFPPPPSTLLTFANVPHVYIHREIQRWRKAFFRNKKAQRDARAFLNSTGNNTRCKGVMASRSNLTPLPPGNHKVSGKQPWVTN